MKNNIHDQEGRPGRVHVLMTGRIVHPCYETFDCFSQRPAASPEIALGRRRAEGAEDVDQDEWDQGVSDFVHERVKSKKLKFDVLKAELRATPADIRIDTDAGKAWRQKSEEMHVIGIELYAEIARARREAFEKAKIIVMTLDGFTQLASGTSANSFLIEKKEFVIAVVDESHQLQFSLVAAVATTVRSMLLLWDLYASRSAM